MVKLKYVFTSALLVAAASATARGPHVLSLAHDASGPEVCWLLRSLGRWPFGLVAAPAGQPRTEARGWTPRAALSSS